MAWSVNNVSKLVITDRATATVQLDSADIVPQMQVYIKHAQKFLYVAEIDETLLLKIGKAKYEPNSSEWKLQESGKNWGIWQKC